MMFAPHYLLFLAIRLLYFVVSYLVKNDLVIKYRQKATWVIFFSIL